MSVSATRPVASHPRLAELALALGGFAIGTNGADFEALGRFSTKTPKKLKGLQFRELFVWLSRSMSTVSASVPGERISLPATDSWAEIEV